MGKTYVAAGLAAALRRRGADVGVMKPFSAGPGGAADARMLARAAGSSDPARLINPQHFAIAASPHTARRVLGTRPRTGAVLAAFRRLCAAHEVVVAEGMGGVMVPITRRYYVADLVREMGAGALIVAGNRVGSINHAVMTAGECKRRRVRTLGFVINATDPRGYEPAGMARDLASLTGLRTFGALRRVRGGERALWAAFERDVDVAALVRRVRGRPR